MLFTNMKRCVCTRVYFYHLRWEDISIVWGHFFMRQTQWGTVLHNFNLSYICDISLDRAWFKLRTCYTRIQVFERLDIEQCLFWWIISKFNPFNLSRFWLISKVEYNLIWLFICNNSEQKGIMGNSNVL